jgi:hypothetical protein
MKGKTKQERLPGPMPATAANLGLDHHNFSCSLPALPSRRESRSSCKYLECLAG